MTELSGSARQKRCERVSVPWGKEKPPATEGSVDELERLAKLRSEDLLTEDEYAAAKGRLLPRAGA